MCSAEMRRKGPDPSLCEPCKKRIHIVHIKMRDPIDRAHRRPDRLRIIEVDRALRQKDRMHAGGFRRAEDRPCIAGILQVLEDQKKRGLPHEDLIQVELRLSLYSEDPLRIFRIRNSRKALLPDIQDPLRGRRDHPDELRVLPGELRCRADRDDPLRRCLAEEVNSFRDKKALHIAGLLVLFKIFDFFE